MLPENMKSKKSVEDVKAEIEQSKIISAPKFLNNPSCSECSSKSNLFVCLFKGKNIFQPICQNCLNMNRQNIVYFEDTETYHKRLKINYFKGWKLDDKNK